MAELFSQGGYAFYVWSSYGMGLILLLVELVQLRNRHRTILARLGRLMRMQAGRGNK
ncbi:MAG: heme exporter protein CcmD [Chromatiaceae bacterium]|nr:heme exporter protein CcmD [Chromatiaceae bacterium]